ncbi:uncharacterized protein LOC115704623 [Cannabis sativa]|uniref:uncharacterized protein LOC115704623 n=1 Tax=Cannabis sativa TaxID=3483 RepID=UPI0029CA8AFB|nr:uncharacterized protein LOC115704623 [Cannabis sativa]
MNQQIQGANALSPGDLPLKRKRGRPRKDESLVKGESVQAVAGSESVKKSRLSLDSGDGVDKMVGQVVSGVIEGSFDDGYLLNVKIGDTDTELRGVVFLPGHFTPVNPTNDVAPLVPMYKRKEMPIPTPNPHPQPSGSAHPENSNKQSTEAKDQVPTLTDQSQPSQSQPGVFVALKDKSLIDIVPQVDCIPKDNTDLSLSGTFVAPPSNEPGLDSRTSDVTAPMECDKAVYTLFKIEASKLMKEPNEVVTNRSSEAEQPSPEPVSERRPDIETSTVVKGPNEVDTKRSSEVEPSLAPVSEILPLTETSILVKGLDSVKENKESKEEHTPPPAIISQGIEVVGEKSKVQDQVLSSSTRKSLIQAEMKIPNFELNQPPPTVLSKFELTTFETENKSVNNGYGEGVVEGIESSPTRNQIQPEMMLEGETIPKISSEKKMFF